MPFTISDLRDTQPVDPSLLTKIITSEITGYVGKRRAKDIILPPSRPWDGRRYTTKKDYKNELMTAMVLNNGDFTEVGGSKELLKEYKPQSFKLKTSYNIDDLEEYAYLNKIQDVKNSLVTKAFIEHKSIMDNSKNALTIFGTEGGVNAYPLYTGDGGMKLTDMDFGKIHSNSATDKTLNSVTIVGNWSAAGKTWSDIEADHEAVFLMFESKGVDKTRIKVLHSPESWAAQKNALKGINTSTRGINIDVQKINQDEMIIDGVTHIRVSDSVIVNSVTHYLCAAKHVK